MEKKINIERTMVPMVTKIEVDGKSYPINQRNVDLASDYLISGDEKALENLVDFSLDI